MENYPLFGYQAFVTEINLIQVFVVDIAWIVFIIEHPLARKKLQTLFKCPTVRANSVTPVTIELQEL